MLEQEISPSTSVKKQLNNVLMLISWREFARRYFGKSSSWLYHKLDGLTEFTETERLQMKSYLRQLAKELNDAADAIS